MPFNHADRAFRFSGNACGYNLAMTRVHRALAWRLAGAAFCIAVFASLTEDVHDHERWPVDRTALIDLHRYRSPTVTDVWLVFTQAGSYLATGAAALLLAWWLWHRLGRRTDACFVSAAVVGAMVLGLVVKAAVHRPRPHLWAAATPTLGYSFPSAHAMNSMAVTLAIVLVGLFPRRLTLTIGVAYVGLVGLSRVWLGAHYPTDVVAGWALSAGWVLLLFVAVYRARPLPTRAAGVLPRRAGHQIHG